MMISRICFYAELVGLAVILALPGIAKAQETSGEQGAEAVVSGKLVSNVFAATPVAVGQEVSLKQGVISIEVEHKSGASRDHARTRGFRVLFGNLSADQHGKGKLATLNANDGSGGIYRDVEWQVLSGYAMARGWRPRIRGTTATAAAEGTEFICQNEQVVASDGTVTEITRIYLISGSDVKVIANDNSTKQKSLTAVDHYIEARKVSGVTTLTEPAPIPADSNDPLRSFVNEVRAISLAAGL